MADIHATIRSGFINSKSPDNLCSIKDGNLVTDSTSSGFPKIPAVSALWISSSVLVSVLVTLTSLCGILFPGTYSREVPSWTIQAIGQDYTNLAVVVLLLVSTFFVMRRSLRGYLVWLGAWLYLAYAFMIYAFALHFQFLFLAYLAILGLSGYTLAGGLMAVDRDIPVQVLRKNPHMRLAGFLLFAIGILFSVMWLSEIIPNILAGTIPVSLVEMKLPVNPVHVLDLAFMLPGMIITAILLWHDDAAGFLIAVPLLVFSVTMGLGIIVMMVLSAISHQPYSIPAVIIVGAIMVMGTGVSYLCLRTLE
jgi:hypothetical protein